MKSHVIKFKQDNMLCHRCAMNVVQGLSKLKSVEKIDINVEKKLIKVVCSDTSLSRRIVQEIVNESIEKDIIKKSKVAASKDNKENVTLMRYLEH